MSRPLTVSMTPAFLFEGDWLLRAQLRCLSEQVAKDFDVVIIDHHYSKRAGYMPELAIHYKLNITHIPYKPNTFVAKKLDCSIFNAPYCYSESPRIVRYSCWRFVRPDFTKICLESPTNVDFRFHSVHPTSPVNTHPDTDHNTDIWNKMSDVVNWDKIPEHAKIAGATWGKDSDIDAPVELFPTNCYGNYMVFRDQWLDINGCEEAFTNTAHYEDMDFCIRARNKGMVCSRKAHKLYRLHHWYGNHSGRANIPPDHQFKHNCPACEQACQTLEPTRFDIKNRAAKGEIDLLDEHGVWVCKTCLLCGPVYHADCGEHLTGHVAKKKIIKSNIIPKYKLGRNLRILAERMGGNSLQDKVFIYNDSWSNDRYYAP